MKRNTNAHTEPPKDTHVHTLLPVNYEGGNPTVNARDMHEALEVATPYKDGFPRMRQYGFVEGKDFSTIWRQSTGGRPSVDHEITIAMAKELCMLQRSPVGREFRRYFINLEQTGESPNQIMERALMRRDASWPNTDCPKDRHSWTENAREACDD